MRTRINLTLNAALILAALSGNAHAHGGGVLVSIFTPFILIPLGIYSVSLIRKSNPEQVLSYGEVGPILASFMIEGLFVLFEFRPLVTAWTSDGPVRLTVALFLFASASLITKLFLLVERGRKRI